MSESDVEVSPGLRWENAGARQRRRRTWPALLFTALFVGGLTIAIGFSILTVGRSGSGSSLYGESFHIPAVAIIACVAACLGTLAVSSFLKSRQLRPQFVRNFSVLIAVSSVASLALIQADRLGYVIDYSNRAPPMEQAAAINDVYADRVLQASTRLNQNLEEIFGHEGLLVTHLPGPQSLPDLRRRLADSRVAVKQFDVDVQAARAEVWANLDAATLNPFERESIRNMFEEGFSQADEFHRRETELAERMLRDIGFQLDLLERERGGWRLSGNMIVFDHPTVLREFNQTQAELMETQATMTALRQTANTAQNRYAPR